MTMEVDNIPKLKCLCLSLLVDMYEFEDVLCLGQEIVDIIFCSDYFWTLPVQKQTAALIYVIDKLDLPTAQNLVCVFATRENINFNLGRLKNSGFSVAHYLMRTVNGREILKMHNSSLARLIDSCTLNYIVPEYSVLRGESVALHLALSLDSHDSLLVEACQFSDRLEAHALNYMFAEHHRIYPCFSVASVLASSPFGRALLRQNGNRLSRMLTVDVLNSRIVAPGKDLDGCTVAFVLLHHGRVAEYPDIVPKLSATTVNFVHPRHSSFAGLSVAFLLSDVSLSFLFRVWIPMLSSDCLNAVVLTGMHTGMSVACRLARYDISIFIADDYKLARLLQASTLEEVNSSDRSFESIVYWLCAAGAQGIDLLTLDNFRLAKQITCSVLNSIVSVDKIKNESVAYKLVSEGGTVGLNILKLDDFRLARMLRRDALNAVVATESREGESLALLLASDEPVSVVSAHVADEGCTNRAEQHSLGWTILELDECRLGRLISEQTLNQVVASQPMFGQSVAFWLSIAASRSPNYCLQYLLSYDNFRLGSAISSSALNSICNMQSHQWDIGENDRIGESTLFWLACSDVGLDLLAMNSFELARLVNKASLNFTVRSPRHKGQSAGSMLKGSEKGRRILAANDNRLGYEMSPYALIIDSGKKTVQISVDYLLSFVWIKEAVVYVVSSVGMTYSIVLVAVGIVLLFFDGYVYYY